MNGCKCGCGCGCGQEHKSHEHSCGEHKKRKEIIMLSVSAVLLFAAVITTRIFDFGSALNLLIFAVPFLIVGGEVLKEAAENIIHGEFFGECFLMSVATIGAMIIGEYSEAVFVMLFFRIGEFFEQTAEEKSRNSIAKLMDMKSDSAAVLTNGDIIKTTLEQVKVGDIIEVKPGERIPLDGVVTVGSATLDTSSLTGEAIPKAVTVGENVQSGCINTDGMLHIKVGCVYGESTVARILELVEHAAERKSKPVKFITRFSKVYTPAVIVTALLLAAVPSLIWGNTSSWVYRALMFLVVSCPCALVVSVPLTYFCGIGGASRKGILIKGADTLEKLALTKTAVFDKTGTLTEGAFSVKEIHAVSVRNEVLLKTAAYAEYYSNHPIAKSIKTAYEKEIDPELIEEITESGGFGIKAKIAGKKVLCGNIRLLLGEGVKVDANIDSTAVFVAIDGEYAGFITVSDAVKKDTAAALTELKQNNIHTVMLTGDNDTAAQSIAEELRFGEYHAELLPDGKVECFRKIKEENDGTCVFAGDGINDAPVLAVADVGVAMGALGSDAAIEAADMVIMNDSLLKLPLAVRVARKTYALVRQNIVFTLAVKFAVLLLSAVGLSNMWFAVLADVGVLVLAVLNAMRALKSE